MKNIFKKALEYSLCLLAFFLTFQTKLILFPAETNYNEIAIYFNYFLLFFSSFLYLVYFLKYEEKGKRDTFTVNRYIIALAGLEFFLFLSIFVSALQGLAIFKYVLFLLSLSLFFVILNFKFNFKRFLYFFISGLLVQAFVGIYQFFSQKIFSCKYLGIAAHDAYVLGTSVLENEQGRLLRAYGGLDHPNIFGALMFFAVIFVVFLLLQYNFKGYKKILHYFILAIFSLGLMVSFSRSAFLALFLSLLSLLIFFLVKKNKTYLKIYTDIIIFFFLLFVAFFFVFRPLILDRVDTNSRLEKISISERKLQLESATEIILNNPWTGVGFGSYHQKLLSINSGAPAYEAQPVHNVFVLIWAESGIFALVFFLLFLFFVFWQNRLSFYFYPVFIGLFVFMMLDHWLFSLPFGLLILFFIISLTFKFKDDKVKH